MARSRAFLEYVATVLVFGLCAQGLVACGGEAAASDAGLSDGGEDATVEEHWSAQVYAESPLRWAGVAVSEDGRVFASFPRWSADIQVSVVEVDPAGEHRVFPEAEWNNWQSGDEVEGHFVCVQSLIVDAQQRLWILDAGNPYFRGVLPGAARLILVDLDSGQVLRQYAFGEQSALPGSYLNDVRVDLDHGVAYLTDSSQGALLVLDLDSGESRRLLEAHPSTQAEEVEVVVEDVVYPHRVHVDSLAYDPVEDMVYYKALKGDTLYRVPGEALRAAFAGSGDLASQVEPLDAIGPTDGIAYGAGGLLFTDLESNAVGRWSGEGDVEQLFQDEDLHWPDAIALDSQGRIFVSTSQIHLGATPVDPFRIYVIHRE